MTYAVTFDLTLTIGVYVDRSWLEEHMHWHVHTLSKT